jgi:hypothetical protein
VTPHPQHGWDDIRAVPTVVHALHAWAALTPSKTALTWVRMGPERLSHAAS